MIKRWLKSLKKWFLMKLKWRYLRNYSKMQKKMEFAGGQGKFSPEQIKGFGIVKNLAMRQEAEILIAPLSNKIYIKDGDLNIIVERGQMSIINGVYHYDISMNDNISDQVFRYLYRIIDRRRIKMEVEMRAKIERSLDYIYYETKHRKKPELDKKRE